MYLILKTLKETFLADGLQILWSLNKSFSLFTFLTDEFYHVVIFLYLIIYDLLISFSFI